MSSKVFVRFVNESQWLALCAHPAGEEGFLVPPDLRVEWTALEGPGAAAADSIECSFEEFVEQMRGRWDHSYQYSILLIISGTNLISTEVSIPSKQTRHIAQAIPFMIEDQVAEDVSDLHVVIGERDAEGQVPVLAMPDRLIENTISLFKQHDLPLVSMLPDMLCLPMVADEWTMMVDGRHLLVRRGPMSGMSIEMDAAPVILASIMETWAPLPGTLRVMMCQDRFNKNLKNWLKSQISGSVAAHSEEITIEYEDINSSEFLLLASEINQSMARKLPYDMLQGHSSAAGQRAPSMFNWKPLAALVALFVVAQTGFLYVKAGQMNAEADRISLESRKLYKDIFPQDRIRDPKRQMAAHIADFQAGGGNQGFLPLLALAGQQMYEANLKQSDSIQPQRFSFDSGNGDLKVDLMIKDFSQLESLKTSLQQANLDVETTQASQEADAVKARMNIRSQS